MKREHPVVDSDRCRKELGIVSTYGWTIQYRAGMILRKYLEINGIG